jgi:hypothetical protein
VRMCLRARLDERVRTWCVRMWAGAGTCGRVHVALLTQRANLMSLIVLSSAASLAPPYFSALSHKRYDFLKNVIGHKMCVWIFSTTFS